MDALGIDDKFCLFREGYVKAYIDFIFNSSVERQFDAFSSGFFRVCESQVMGLLHPKELKGMLIGQPVTDLHPFEKVAVYAGVTKDEPLIGWFWSFLHDLPQEKKRTFFKFLTGSDRIPIGAIATQIKIRVDPVDPKVPLSHLPLPTAVTCMSILMLPNYPSQELLDDKLSKAIDYTGGQGFGFQ